jgi:hypothetical protein
MAKIIVSSRSGADIADDWCRIVRKHAGHRRQVANVMVQTRNNAIMAAWLVVML